MNVNSRNVLCYVYLFQYMFWLLILLFEIVVGSDLNGKYIQKVQDCLDMNHSILDTRIFILCPSFHLLVTLVLSSLDSETGGNGELW